MADINQVVLVGRLTRDAEMKYTSGGTAVSKIGLAVNRRVKKGDTWTDEASFFDVAIWGKQAESLNPYLLKGQQVAISGELRQDRWEQDGQKRSRVEIAANDVQLLGRPAGSEGGQARPAVSSPSSSYARPERDNRSPEPSPPSHFDGGFDDDIPF